MWKRCLEGEKEKQYDFTLEVNKEKIGMHKYIVHNTTREILSFIFTPLHTEFYHNATPT